VFLEDAEGGDSGMTMSPTLSIAASAAGVILGTAAYMSPEQARGKKVDRRADIWAFGVVLFEMLAGKQLFAGETISDTLASVIKDEPDWTRLPDTTPPLVIDLIRRCLAKNPRRRLQSIGEARIALEESLHGSGDGASHPTLLSSSLSQSSLPVQAPVGARGRSLPTFVWVLLLVAVAAVAAFVGSRLGHETSSAHMRRFVMRPSGLRVAYPTQPMLSPDGRRVAYFSTEGLCIRDLHALRPVLVPGTANATSPFWSPDGHWLAFGMEGRIYKVPAVGGTPLVICDVPFGALDGAAWGDDGQLVLAPNTGPMFVVSDGGGDPTPLFPLGNGETDYHTPCVLPHSNGIVFTTHGTSGRNTIEVYSGGQRKVLLKIPGARLEYAAWSALPGSERQGHLVYHRLTSNPGIWAMPFDLGTLTVTGDPFLIDSSGSFPSVGRDGSLLYATGSGSGLQQVVFVDRSGEIVRRIGQPQMEMQTPRLSPDGRSVLVSANDSDSRDIWLHDVDRGTRTRMTFSPQAEISPIWFDGGRQIAFTIAVGGVSNEIQVRPADGTGQPRTLAQGYQCSIVDGVPWMVFTRFGPDTGQDLYYQRIDGTDSTQVFLATPATEIGADLSPDGRFIAYFSNDSGRNEIYMKPFPSGTGKWQVSTNTGSWPRWSRAGDAIVYRESSEANGRMMRVSVETSPHVVLGTPTELFSSMDAPEINFRSGARNHDTTTDPDILIMLEDVSRGEGSETRLVFAENWFASYRSEQQ
jgi:Tol biopolymer transport system component